MKPRLKYSSKPTIEVLIHRYIEKMETVKPLGLSHKLTLLKEAREQLGPVVAAELTRDEVILYAEAMTDLCPATRNQYITYLGGVLKYAGSTPSWPDCKDVHAGAIEAAKPYLTKHGLIGKSQKRDRRPTQEELERLFDLFVEQNQRPKNKIDMVVMGLWQVASGRRVGESCALLWEDWNREEQTILVRKMKDPRGKKSKWVALTPEATSILQALEPMKTTDRIFPYNSHSVSARYTEAKRILGIVNLRLHDSRRECASRLLEKGYTARQVILVTGHEKEDGAANVYMKMNPATFKDGPLGADRTTRVGTEAFND